MAGFLARWFGFRASGAVAPPEDPVGLALTSLQADVRRLGSVSVRSEAQIRQMAERLDGLSTALAVGLDRLAGQAAHAVETQARLTDERARLIGGFLDFADALVRAERVLSAAADAEARDAVARLSAHFMRVLRDAGVETVAGEGAPFDPRVHRAIGRVARAALAGRVAAVDRAGYWLDGRLLRIADVLVGIAPGPEAMDVEPAEVATVDGATSG